MNRDLKGRVVMVTGANQGIGYQIAQVLPALLQH
jgi:NAD(P)-dependent dehydrogenase (short-subunit alcohol dehydrogenase family)